MSQPEPIIIRTNQLDDPIYTALLISKIIHEVPSINVIISHELRNGHHNRSNSRGTGRADPQSEEDEDDMDEEPEEDDMQEEVEVIEIKKEEVEVIEIKKEEVEVIEIKKEEIKDEIVSQCHFNQLHDSNTYLFRNDIYLDESSLSLSSKANIKYETYDWGQFSIE